MATSYLTLIGDFASKWGLPSFSGIVGATEATAKQLLALTHEVTEELQEHSWPSQNIRKTWSAVAGEDQGTLLSIFGAGYRKLVPGTFWDQTLKRPVFGPVGEQTWQGLKGFAVGGPVYQYRIAEGKIFVNPAMPVNESLSAIYTSSYGVVSVGGALKARVTADDDTFLYPDRVFKLSLEWRWLKQKGEAWATSRSDAEAAILQNINKDNALPMVQLDGENPGLVPGIWVPAGDWPHS